MKIRPVETELFHAEGRTDMKKLIVGLRSSANSPKNWFLSLCEKKKICFSEQFEVLKK
jgi:hypothetical protein